MMDKEQLKKELKDAAPDQYITCDAFFKNGYFGGDDEVVLDGSFTIEELESITKALRKYMEK